MRQRKGSTGALYGAEPLRCAALLWSQVSKVRRQRRSAAHWRRLVAPQQQHQVQTLRNVGACYKLLHQRVHRRGQVVASSWLPRRAAHRLHVRNDDVGSLVPRRRNIQPEQADKLRSKCSAIVQGYELLGCLSAGVYCRVQQRADFGSDDHSAVQCTGQMPA